MEKIKHDIVLADSKKANGYIYEGISTKNLQFSMPNDQETCSGLYTPKHMYFTSFAQIKKGDWMIYAGNGSIEQCDYEETDWRIEYGWRKITATTDPELGLPLISSPFVKGWVDNQVNKILVDFKNGMPHIFLGSVYTHKLEGKIYSEEDLWNIWCAGAQFAEVSMSSEEFGVSLNEYNEFKKLLDYL